MANKIIGWMTRGNISFSFLLSALE